MNHTYNANLFPTIAQFVTATVDSMRTDVGRSSCWQSIEEANGYTLVASNTIYGNGEFMVFKDGSKAYLSFNSMRFYVK